MSASTPSSSPSGSRSPTSSAPAPRRRRRWPWIFLGGFIAGIAVIVGALLTPAVQAWLVRRVVATQPGWSVDFERFGATPAGVEVHGLDFAMPGINARSAPIAIRIAPGRLLNRRELRIERVEARKLRVTLTPADLPSSSEPFTGLMPLLQSPLAWALDDAQLDGEIVVQDAGQSLVVGTFALNGGGLSADQPGEFAYEIDVNSRFLPLGPDNRIRSRGTVRLTQDAAHGVRQIVVSGDLALPRYGGIALPPGHFTLTVDAAKNGEDYRARLDLGDHAVFEFSGHLDAALARLTGRASSRLAPEFAAALAGERVPAVSLTGTADVALDLARGDADVTLSAGITARDWSRLAPELAAVDAFTGQLAAALTRRAGRISITRLDATLHGENSPAAARLALTAPIDPNAFPSTPIATVTLERLPLAWANPWLAPADVALAPADLNATWHLSLDSAAGRARLTPARPLEIATLAAKATALPPLPPLRLAVSPTLELTADDARVSFDDFTLTSSSGDRIALTLAARYDFASATAHAQGTLHGTAPTLLSGTEKPLPFTFAARWDAALAGENLRVAALEFAVHEGSRPEPCLAFELLQPLALDLAKLAAPATAAPTDLARLRFDQLPLGWLSRWLDGYTLAGNLHTGTSVLRADADGRLTLDSPQPWRIADATFGVGGKDLFAGEIALTPGFAVHADRYTARLENLDALHHDGSRIRGSITAEAQLRERKASTTLALDAELPSLPHSAGTFGPLFATLRAKSHNESATIAVVDEFELRVRNRDRELLAVAAPAPFLAGLSNTGMFSAGTVAPLTLTTGEIPLAWLNPFVDGIVADGLLQPSEFAFTAELTKFRLRPIKPVHVRDFSARVAGRDIARDMEFTFHPGLDLTLICIPFPTFQLAFTGTAHLTNGAIDVAGRRAVDVDAALGFIGNDQTVLPNSVEYTTRADFAALSRVPALAGSGFPASGIFVARANGDLLGQAPLEVWARLEGLASIDRSRTLPAFELTARGNVSRDQTLSAAIALQLETAPQPTDARFEARLNLAAGNLELASGFHSAHLDAAEALAFVEALYAPPPAATGAPNTTTTSPTSAAPRTYAQLGVPFWSHLRGHFDLDLGTVRYAPYQIDRVRGRLDLRDRELVLSNLSGEMFAGRWSGGARIAYDPANTAADHTATGEFRIEQFDSARVVQTVFPTELASVDARIDVRSTLRSRGNALFELIDRAEGEFTVEGREGIVRLTVPKQEMAATAAVFGGTLLLSPELRALGRLLKKFAEMPVDQIRISGERRADGDVLLREFRVDSPQARLLAQGRIPAVPDEPLMNRPLELSIDLAAKDEMAVILGGMSLIEKKPRPDGYRALKQTFELRGKAGEPDTRPLYDLFAKAVMGSKGTWGFLMRKAQAQLDKMKPAATAP